MALSKARRTRLSELRKKFGKKDPKRSGGKTYEQKKAAADKAQSNIERAARRSAAGKKGQRPNWATTSKAAEKAAGLDRLTPKQKKQQKREVDNFLGTAKKAKTASKPKATKAKATKAKTASKPKTAAKPKATKPKAAKPSAPKAAGAPKVKGGKRSLSVGAATKAKPAAKSGGGKGGGKSGSGGKGGGGKRTYKRDARGRFS